MPGYDRTGPQGQGSRTGRAQGKCAPKENNNVSNENSSEQSMDFRNSNPQGRGFKQMNHDGRGQGRGLGRGRSGEGRGFRRGF
ncbi:MAG: DUF5320 domain-containing protein [Bacteroidota bacterium]|nr:DUF5320 domain-containing protein [Bacteroidota bacterium]